MKNITIDQFVDREVVLGVSSTIWELTQIQDRLDYDTQESLMDAWTTEPDYEEAAIADGWGLDGSGRFTDGENIRAFEGDWAGLCELEGIVVEDFRREVFEHYVVTPSFARQLRNHGETVVDDIMGLGPIWCRTTTGQGIANDGVIEEIYSEVMA